jgi:hypothetical protein
VDNRKLCAAEVARCGSGESWSSGAIGQSRTLRAVSSYPVGGGLRRRSEAVQCRDRPSV